MDEVAPLVDGFLKAAGWSDASLEPLAGDMSSRRYFRVRKKNVAAILMVADTPMQNFVEITKWLNGIDLSAPKIIHDRSEHGLLLLEDFGDHSVNSALRNGDVETENVFEDCVTLLLKIRAATPPRLVAPSLGTLVDWTALADEHYPNIKSSGLGNFRVVLGNLLREALTVPLTTSLRDFHTENMMWLPERVGIKRLGLLDYQDAILTHPAYDLMSLLTDARTWIPKPLRNKIISSYVRQSGDAPEAFRSAFAALSAQRNLRILGIFARARRHLEKMPNTYRYFHEALEHPEFDAVRNEVLEAVPAPERLA